MNPTQYELATLAATFTGGGSPQDRAKAAIAIWKACGAELEAAEKLAAQAEEIEQALHDVRSLFAGRTTIPFEEFLKYLMPDSRPEDRAKRYRGYLRWNVRMNDEQEGLKARSESNLDDAVSKIIQDDKKIGISPNGFTQRVKKIREVIEFEAKEALSERGKKGAKARLETGESGVLKKSLGSTSKDKKTPQAKRVTRQAKR